MDEILFWSDAIQHPRQRNIREILSRKSKSNRSEQMIENIQNNKPEVGTPINQSTSSRGSNGT